MEGTIYYIYSFFVIVLREYFLLTLTCISYFRNLLIENFIPPEEKNKIMNRLYFDSEEDQWRLQPVLPERSVDSFHIADSCYCQCSSRRKKNPPKVKIVTQWTTKPSGWNVSWNQRYQFCISCSCFGSFDLHLLYHITLAQSFSKGCQSTVWEIKEISNSSNL